MSRSNSRTSVTPANEPPVNLVNATYKYSSSSGQRPTSAGPGTRSRSSTSNSNAYGRNNAGTTNIYISNNPILVATQAGANPGSSRPSSAGHVRPTAQPQPQNVNIQYSKNTSYLVPNQSGYGSINVSTPSQGPSTAPPVVNTSGPSLPGYARPKSAGAIRRTVSSGSPAVAPSNPQYAPIQAPYGQHVPQQKQVADQSMGQVSSGGSKHASGGSNDHWSTSYKLHYGYSNPGNGGVIENSGSRSSLNPAHASSQNLNAHPTNGNTTRYQVPSEPVKTTSAPMVDPRSDRGERGNPREDPRSDPPNTFPPQTISRPSSASSRIRSAIGQSQKYSLPADATEDDDGDMGLDAVGVVSESRPQGSHGGHGGHGTHGGHGGHGGVIRGGAVADEDDDEMDGKPVSDSRSHPEISTPSQSLELAGATAQSIGIDARNSSIESYMDENIDVGLSTVPNQFCTAKDALELKKFLLMSNNSRGGIVPSSTAVMDMYMVGKVVGVGSYGKVRAAWHRLTSSKVAIKTYDKAKLKDPAHWKRVHSEIKIMEQVSHPRIARMYEAVETPKRMHLIMECLDGGNLCSYVKQKRRLSEEESKRIFFQVLIAIEHLHALGVTHRDVKLENVLFTDDGQTKDVKLIDFGFATVCQPGKKLKVFCGTPSYMAPEIVRRLEYEGKPVDIWSLGIFLYALLCGCFPFRAKSYPDLYRRIARGLFTMPEELSTSVKDLLTNLLEVDPSKRITAYAAMRHPWLAMQFSTAPDMDRMRKDTAIYISDKPMDDIDEEVIQELQRFGLLREDIVRLVMTKMHASMTTLYYLLLDCVSKRRKLVAKRSGHGGSSGKKIGTSQSSMGASSAGPIRSINAYANASSNPILSTANAGDYHAAAAMLQRQQAHQQHTAQVQAHLQQQQQQAHIQQAQQYVGVTTAGYALRPDYVSSSGAGVNVAGGSSSRPKSASATRPSNTATQRPLSAYAGRR